MTETKTLKEPYEGIDGQDRDDFLLSLDPAAWAHREALFAVAKNLRHTMIVGNPAPIVTKLWERLSRPQPGDLVVECSKAIYGRGRDSRLHGLGILLARRREQGSTDEVFYVQYGSRRWDIARWGDCEFMAIMTGTPETEATDA